MFQDSANAPAAAHVFDAVGAVVGGAPFAAENSPRALLASRPGAYDVLLELVDRSSSARVRENAQVILQMLPTRDSVRDELRRLLEATAADPATAAADAKPRAAEGSAGDGALLSRLEELSRELGDPGFGDATQLPDLTLELGDSPLRLARDSLSLPGAPSRVLNLLLAQLTGFGEVLLANGGLLLFLDLA